MFLWRVETERDIESRWPQQEVFISFWVLLNYHFLPSKSKPLLSSGDNVCLPIFLLTNLQCPFYTVSSRLSIAYKIFMHTLWSCCRSRLHFFFVWFYFVLICCFLPFLYGSATVHMQKKKRKKEKRSPRKLFDARSWKTEIPNRWTHSGYPLPVDLLMK